jgi:endoglucanase
MWRNLKSWSRVLILLLAILVRAEDLPHNEVQRIQKQCEIILRSAYMSNGARAHCVQASYKNWEHFPVKRCDYQTPDRRSSVVYVLDADANKLARWVVKACTVAAGPAEPKCADMLVETIWHDSGAEFPVAGVVLESNENLCQKCCFRDGVTISVKGWRDIRNLSSSATKEEVDLCLTAQITGVGKFARIQSTTPEEYKDNGGREDVGTDDHPRSSWLTVIRQSYQKAWTSDYNDLMVAKARSLMSEESKTNSPQAVK